MRTFDVLSADGAGVGPGRLRRRISPVAARTATTKPAVARSSVAAPIHPLLIAPVSRRRLPRRGPLDLRRRTTPCWHGAPSEMSQWKCRSTTLGSDGPDAGSPAPFGAPLRQDRH